LPPTFRKRDFKQITFHHLPPGVSNADMKALENKRRAGTLSDKDFDDLCRKYGKPMSSLATPWNKTTTVEERVFHKRKRQGKLIEEKQFNFESICRQLEAFDSGKISDFVEAVRL